ncbi:MAG: hypothetical protein ABI853_02195 [Sphingomicrobium sp.]
MAKKATNKGRTGGTKSMAKSTALVERRTDGGGRRSSDAGMSDAFIKLLQSPLVAELVAVAATAALASLAEHGFTSSGGSRGKRAGKAVKEAGKSAAAAVGRRLSNEIDEIKKAAKVSKGGAKA